MADKSDNKAKDRAERAFKKEEQARAGAKAMASYEEEGRAIRKNMARLREQRLARDAAQANAAADKAGSGKKADEKSIPISKLNASNDK